jgi:hypothetical protein
MNNTITDEQIREIASRFVLPECTTDYHDEALILFARALLSAQPVDRNAVLESAVQICEAYIEQAESRFGTNPGGYHAAAGRNLSKRIRALKDTPQPAPEAEHPLSSLHVNQGSMDAVADMYEAEYLAAKHQAEIEKLVQFVINTRELAANICFEAYRDSEPKIDALHEAGVSIQLLPLPYEYLHNTTPTHPQIDVVTITEKGREPKPCYVQYDAAQDKYVGISEEEALQAIAEADAEDAASSPSPDGLQELADIAQAPELTDYERCQHPDCGRFKDGAGWGCRAMRDNACAKDEASDMGYGEAQKAGEATLYVEVRECSGCNHIGVNDSPSDKSACNSCGWVGPYQKEDHCPECRQDGTMTSACPECGDHITCLIASANLPIANQPAQPQGSELPPTNPCGSCGKPIAVGRFLCDGCYRAAAQTRTHHG